MSDPAFEGMSLQEWVNWIDSNQHERCHWDVSGASDGSCDCWVGDLVEVLRSVKPHAQAAEVDRLRAERDEAREFGEKAATAYNEQLQGIVLTCVFCGHRYPRGTPRSNHETLEAHIYACEKHPLRAAEERASELAEVLLDAVDAIETLPQDSLGVVYDEDSAWSVKRELLSKARKALANHEAAEPTPTKEPS